VPAFTAMDTSVLPWFKPPETSTAVRFRRRVRVCPVGIRDAQRDDVLPAGIGLEAERRFIRNRVLPQLTFKPALGDRPCVAQVVVAGIGCRSELLSALLHQADLVIC